MNIDFYGAKIDFVEVKMSVKTDLIDDAKVKKKIQIQREGTKKFSIIIDFDVRYVEEINF